MRFASPEKRAVKRSSFAPLTAVAAVATNTTSVSANDGTHTVVLANHAAIRWHVGPADLSKGSRIAVLSGDPTNPGPFGLHYVHGAYPNASK